MNSREQEQLAALAATLGVEVRSVRALSGGCVARALVAEISDGRGRIPDRIVVKLEMAPDSTLVAEGQSLRDLAAAGLPVPEVLHAEPGVLALAFVENDGVGAPGAELHAADLLSDLHAHTAPRFGYAYSTPLGGLAQDNTWTDTWPHFFGRCRLIPMARAAAAAGALPPTLIDRIERLSDRLPHVLEPAAPALIHGDVWGGNVLMHRGRIAAFIDPAVSYADPELELAFLTLFGTFGRSFFERYHDRRPIGAGFFEWRKDLYNIYPLLVHARLFGGGYGAQAERTLARVEAEIG